MNHHPRAGRGASLRGREGQRGVTLVEAVVAFGLVTLTAVAVLRIQATWTLAGQDAARHTQAARLLQTEIDRMLALAAPLQAGTVVAVPADAATTGWSRTAVPGAASNEWSTVWHGGWMRRDGPARTWSVQSQVYRVHPAALARAQAAVGERADGSIALLAPGGRPGAWDLAFDLPPAPLPHSTENVPPAPSSGRPPVAIDTQPVAARACARGPTGRDLRWPACDALTRLTRSGAIRWAPDVLADPALRATLQDWVASVIELPGATDPTREEHCAFRLEPGVDPHLAWRCLGRAWTPATEVPSAPAVSRLPEIGLSSGTRGSAQLTDPLGGLPSGLRACRYLDEPDGAGTEGLAVLQHQRVHWLVIGASRDCPAGTVASGL